ncbi:MAG TPA: C40 family peptidase [Solirubrobacteraceae bacterium]|jgi:cell wall-associated NlpC family hydrolase|nr:C40 family peptidase [Solirubrobacteraceae bacterium]
MAALAIVVLYGCCAILATTARAAAAPTSSSWDAAQQRQVLAAGLMQASGGSFAGAGQLSAAQANATMVALATRLQDEAGEQGVPGVPNAPGEPAAASASAAPVAHTAQTPVTVVTFDRMLVEQLGLASVAAQVQDTAAAAGVSPPPYFGSETVARMLELRYEHPVGAQRLDLFPGDPVTRAEAAWSLAKVIAMSAWTVSYAREALSSFELPPMTSAQRQALKIAVSRIGYPYVWGGTTDSTEDGLEHGGFDCSGFAWRVYKVSGLHWGESIRGRTAAEQAGEIPRSQRLRVDQLEPGDLLFFGSAHFTSKATESNIIHEGIYLGDNWVIHSSDQGVYVLPLNGSWLGSSFAWGRRVIG